MDQLPAVTFNRPPCGSGPVRFTRRTEGTPAQMLRLLTIAAVALTAAAAPAMAQNWTSRNIGGTTFYNGTTPSGQQWNGTGRDIGSSRFYDFNGPGMQHQSCRQTQIGGTTYTNCN